MFLLTHTAIPLLLFEFSIVKRKYYFNRLALVIGALFPDLIDKSFLFLGLSSGRGISHSLIFNFIIFLSVVLIFRKKSIYLPLTLGIALHLFLDLPDLPIFYPFVIYDFEILEEPLIFYIQRLFTYPPVVITESLSLIILIYIGFKNKLYTWNNIKFYFFITHTPNSTDLEILKNYD